MKRLIFPLIAVTFVLFMTPLRPVAAEKPQATSSETAQQKDQYRKSMEERLAKIGKDLDELKAKAEAMTDKSRKELDRYLADAEKKRKAAAQKLDKMETESAQKWKKFTREMDAAANDFEKAFERAKSHFKE